MAKPITIRILGDASGFEKAVAQVDGKLGGLGSGIGKAAAAIGTAFAGAQIGQFFKSSIDAASDMNETISKAGVLFGDSADAVTAWASTAAKAFGQSKKQALDAAGTFAVFGKSAGLSGQDLVGFSTKLTSLASDLASFHNTSPEQAIQAIGSALRGEAEPMRAYGVLLDDATMRQEAMKLGLVSSTKDALAPAIKVQAAYSLILKQTADAQGDYTRTADGLANKQRSAAAAFEDAKTRIGQSLLPAYLQITTVVAEKLVPALESVLPPITDMVGVLLEVSAGALGLVAGLSGAISTIGIFGAGAVAAGFGAVKLVEGIAAVKTALTTLAVASSTAAGGIGILAALVGGAATIAFLTVRRHQQEAAETADRLAEAYRQAKDPTQILTDRMVELRSQLQGVKTDSDGATSAAEVGTKAWIAHELEQRKVIGTANQLGLSAERLESTISTGTNAFEAAKSAVLANRKGYDELMGSVDKYGEAEKSIISPVLAAVAAGRLKRQAAVDLLNALDKLSDGTDDHREAQAAEMRATLQAALSVESISADWLKQHGIIDLGTAKLDDLTRASQAYADQNPKVADGALKVADAAATQADKVDDAEQAAKDWEAAIKGLKDAQDGYLLHAVDYDAAVDSYQSKIRDAAKATADARGDVDNYSEANLKLRDAQRDVVRQAADVITKLAEAGGTADQQQTALATMAGWWSENATRLGLTADEAARTRDMILGIPTRKDVAVNVSVTTTADALWGQIATQRAVGGPASGVIRVGERGPETLLVPNGSSVIPNHAGGGGGDGMNLTINTVSNADAAEIARELSWAMRTSGR